MCGDTEKELEKRGGNGRRLLRNRQKGVLGGSRMRR